MEIAAYFSDEPATQKSTDNPATVCLLLWVWWLLKEPFLFILTGLMLPFLSS